MAETTQKDLDERPYCAGCKRRPESFLGLCDRCWKRALGNVERARLLMEGKRP
jgi:predicted amidophosphoribosyltransferase